MDKKDKEGLLEVDDDFGLDDSDENNEDDNSMPQDGDDQQVANFDDMDDGEDDDEYAHQDPNDLDDDDDEDAPDDDDDNDNQQDFNRKNFAFEAGNNGAKKNQDLNTKKVDNQQFDEALDIDDSNEIESDDDDNEQEVNAVQKTQANNPKMDGGDDEDDDLEVPGQYNPANYANLNVSSEVKELFEYIGRYKPQRIDLETTLRPFVPEFVPCVGEVDAFLKMNKPDGAKEDLGITVLDEPTLN